MLSRKIKPKLVDVGMLSLYKNKIFDQNISSSKISYFTNKIKKDIIEIIANYWMLIIIIIIILYLLWQRHKWYKSTQKINFNQINKCEKKVKLPKNNIIRTEDIFNNEEKNQKINILKNEENIIRNNILESYNNIRRKKNINIDNNSRNNINRLEAYNNSNYPYASI